MSVIPQFANLGRLEIIEVYEFYDIPCLFSCRNKSGQIFIAILVKETRNGNLWLYVYVSLDKFNLVRAGKIDLRDTYKRAEDDFVYKVIIPPDGSPAIVETIPCKNILEEWLPLAGELLDSSSETNLATIETNLT